MNIFGRGACGFSREVQIPTEEEAVDIKHVRHTIKKTQTQARRSMTTTCPFSHSKHYHSKIPTLVMMFSKCGRVCVCGGGGGVKMPDKGFYSELISDFSILKAVVVQLGYATGTPKKNPQRTSERLMKITRPASPSYYKVSPTAFSSAPGCNGYGKRVGSIPGLINLSLSLYMYIYNNIYIYVASMGSYRVRVLY